MARVNRVSRRVATALVVLAIAPAYLSTITICGISGCSGGGFGRSTDPDATLVVLVLTGLVATLPLTVRRDERVHLANLLRLRDAVLNDGVQQGKQGIDHLTVCSIKINLTGMN